MPTYYAVRFVLLIAPYVPPRLGYRICGLLGLLAWRFNGPAREAVASNLPHVTGLPAGHPALRRVLREVLINLVRDYYELTMLATRPREEVLARLVTRDLDRVDEARSLGRGVIAVFCHTSGFNLGMQAVVAGGWPSWVVAEPLEPPAMRRLVNRLRRSLGVRLLTADRAGARGVLRALRANEVVVIAADRGVTGTGAWVPFFGARAFLPTGAAALALRTRAVILPIHICRVPKDMVLLQVGEPLEYLRTGDFDHDVACITQRIAEVFEGQLRERPGQWVVVRRVWEGGPAGTDPARPKGEQPAAVAAR